MVLLLISFTVALIFVVHKWVKNYKFYKHLKCFPLVSKWPVVGVLPDFYNPSNVVTNIARYRADHGPNFMMDIGQKMLIVNDPKLMEVVLGSNKLITKSPEYKLLSRNKWRSRRKILTPGFHYNILQDFVEVFNETSEKLINKLYVELGKPSVDIYQHISLHTLDIICQTAMGSTLNAHDASDSNYVQNVKEICDIMYRKLFSVTNRIESFYKLTAMYKREKNIIDVLREYSNSIIQKRRKTLDNYIQNQEGKIDELGMKGKHTFLDILILSNVDGKSLTDEQIREEVDTFIFEGHDTTAIAICFALYSLSVNPDVQKEAYNEVRTIINSPGSYYEHLQGMKYLEMVIKETLRMYPSVTGFAREVNEDIEYYGGILPKGLTIALIPYVLHRDPELYPDPDKFCPERFSMENQTTRHPYAYVPFSAGPRNCIGQKFAMLEMKSTISKILLHYELLPASPKHEPILISKITIQSLNGIKLQFKKRLL